MIRTLLRIIIVVIGLIMVAALALAGWRQGSVLNACRAVVFGWVAIFLFRSLRRDEVRAQIMKDAEGFALPRDQVIASAAMWIPAVGMLLVFFLYALITGNGLLIAFNVLIAMGLYCAFHYVGKYKWVFLSPTGISGWSTSALWSDPLSIKSSNLNGIVGFRLIKRDSASIFVPAAIARSDAFQSALRRAAPENHVLWGLADKSNGYALR